MGCVGMSERIETDTIRTESETEAFKRLQQEISALGVIMKTCRDCRYGCTGLETGIISCLKMKDLFYAEQANICKHYKSTSARLIPLWRELVKDFKGKLMRRFYS